MEVNNGYGANTPSVLLMIRSAKSTAARYPDAQARYTAFLPYRPLPFLAVIGAQIAPKEGLPATRKLLMGANFPITLEKLGRRKINSPSRHHNLRSPVDRKGKTGEY